MPKAQAYNTTMYIMAGLLVVGFLANLCVKAVDKRHHMKPEADAGFRREPRPAARKEADHGDAITRKTPLSQTAVALGCHTQISRSHARR